MTDTPLCVARETATTPQLMRAAIFRSMYSRWNTNTIARLCDNMARDQGLNGEDAMTLLAFRALCRVEELEARVLEFINCSVQPMFVVKP